MAQDRFIFKAQHFYELLEKQGYRCPYSGRELSPANCVAEHILPLRKQGRHEAGNIALVDQHVSFLKRYLTDEEVLQLAIDILSTMGTTHGIAVSQSKV